MLRYMARLGGGNSTFASAADSSARSLIAVIDNEEMILRIGPVPRAHGGICSLDEVGRMSPDDQGYLLSAMEEGEIHFARWGQLIRLPAGASAGHSQVTSNERENHSSDPSDPSDLDLDGKHNEEIPTDITSDINTKSEISNNGVIPEITQVTLSKIDDHDIPLRGSSSDTPIPTSLDKDISTYDSSSKDDSSKTAQTAQSALPPNTTVTQKDESSKADTAKSASPGKNDPEGIQGTLPDESKYDNNIIQETETDDKTAVVPIEKSTKQLLSRYQLSSLILDEAHRLEEEMVKFVGLSISDKLKSPDFDFKIPDYGYGDMDKWLSFLIELKEKLATLLRSQKILAEHVGEVGLYIIKLEWAIENITKDPTNWIISDIKKEKDKDRGILNNYIGHEQKEEVIKVQLKPLDVSPYCKNIFSKCDKTLMMSATILDKDTFCTSIGLPSKEVKFIQVGSDFPLQHRPIYPLKVAYLNYTELHKDVIKQAIAEAVDRIMTIHKDRKGIIHTTSYEQAELYQAEYFRV